MYNSGNPKILPGMQAKYHNSPCHIVKHEHGHFMIEYQDYSYEFIPENNIERLMQEGLLVIHQNDYNGIVQSKIKDSSIVYTYLKELDNETYPGSKITRLKLIDRLSHFYGKPFSEGYLYKQYRKWIAAGKDIKVISHSNYGYRKSKFPIEVIELAFDVIDKYYLDSEYDRSIATVYEMYEKEHQQNFNEEPKISRSSFYDYVSKLDAYEVCICKYGREVANATYRKFAFHYIPNFPLEVVELDAVHLTLGVLDEVRQKVIGTLIIYLGIDRYTRAILGYSFGIKTDGAGENTKDVIKLIQHIMYPKLPMPHCSNPWFSYGKPTTLLLDAGPAFNNQKVKDVVNGFGATHAVTPTRKPQKKPFIERLMRTVRDHFASSIPGYLDKNDRKNIPANWRELNSFLSLSEIKSLFEYWVCDHYHTHSHKGLGGFTPQEVWHQYYSQPGVIPPIIPDFNPQSFGVKHTATIQGGKGIQFNYSFYNSDELQIYYRYLKTLHNDNPKVTFYIDEDSNPEIIWVDNTNTHKYT